jgi:adenosylhomocysteine nucleosidase
VQAWRPLLIFAFEENIGGESKANRAPLICSAALGLIVAHQLRSRRSEIEQSKQKAVKRQAVVDFAAFVRDKLPFARAHGMSGGIVAVTSLALEARIALGAGVSVICSQGAHLAADLDSALRRGASGIISFGVAGGLAPGLAAGDWIAAAAVRTGQQVFATDQGWTRSLLARLPHAVHADIVGVDTPLAEPWQKQQLHAETGAAAVDMESHIAARVAAAHRVPFVVCRAIIDAAETPLPPAALVGLRPDGTADVLAVCRCVLQQPRQLPALMRTAVDAWIARAALRRGREMLGAGMGFPHFRDSRSDMPGSVLRVPA